MTEIITVGRTNYYQARKGQQQYRVAEGKRLTDTEHAWMVLKDNESGKNYFINGEGVRRWHLPDIFQTQEEKEAEARELKFRRDRRLARERGEKVDEEEQEKEEEEEKKKKEEGADIDYGARDRAAAALMPQKVWEGSADQRRAVIKYVKGVLAPLNAQGDLDEKLFSTVSTTVCKEFFANKSQFDDGAKGALKDEALKYAKARIEEKQVKEEYRKMNAELLAKVKRLDADRKHLNGTIENMQKVEDQQKEEIFKLRAHKQDAVLQSFKRLTRQGLTQTYWFRWKAFKNTLEAQMHVKARERRFNELVENNKKLDEELKAAKEQNEKLHDRVRRSEGRDVINVMLRQSGVYVMSRFYYIWKRWAEASVKEKQFHDMRQQLMDCPMCKQRDIEVDRLKGRVRDKELQWYDQKKEQDQLNEAKIRAEIKAVAVEELVEKLQDTVRDAQKKASELSTRLAWTEKMLFTQENRGRELESEIEQLQFEIMNLSDFSGGNKPGGGGGSGSPGGGTGAMMAGMDGTIGRSKNPLLNAEGHLGHFMTNEHRGLEKRLRDITVGRAAANAERAKNTLEALEEGEPGSGLVGLSAAGATHERDEPTRGVMNQAMGHSIAPGVIPPPPDADDKKGGGGSPRNRQQQYREDSPPPPSEPYPDDLLYRETLAEMDDENFDPARAGTPPPPPLEDEDDDEDDRESLGELLGAMKEHEKELEQKENEKCPKCQFRKKLTPFCPQDGTRHFFQSLMMEPLVKAKVPTTTEEFTLHLRQTKDQAEAARLPQGLPPGANESQAFVRPDSLAAKLRSSVNLNPSQYDGRTAQPLKHTNPYEITRDPAQQNQIEEYIRHTKARAEEARQAALGGRAEGGLAGDRGVSILQSLKYDKARDGPQARSTRPSWSGVFNSNVEGMEGSLRSDPVFGVVHTQVVKPTAAQNMLSKHTTTPNFNK